MSKKRGFILLLFKRISLLFVMGFFILVGFFYCVKFGFFGELFSENEIAEFRNEQASIVYSDEGEIIGKYFDKNRTNVYFEDIPTHLISALIATEDARYFEHEGVDTKSLFRVLIKSIILQNKSAGGGSTITQQLAKNMYGRKSFGLLTMPVNKCKEVILAGRIESIYSKEEILALYLNTVPFGENVYGIEAASKRFFNLSVGDLKTEQAAVLIGLLKANSYYNPRVNPDHAFSRRNTVLHQLYEYNYLKKNELDSLCALPLALDYANFKAQGNANYFMFQVKKEADKILENIKNEKGEAYDLEKDGIIIQSTLSGGMQDLATLSFKEHLGVMQKRLNDQYRLVQQNELDKLAQQAYQKLKKPQKNAHAVDLFSWNGFYTDTISTLDSLKHALGLLHAGLLAINPSNGAVKIWMGGIDYMTQPYDQVLAKRQMASTFKPLLYAVAIENGKEPCDYLQNEAFTLSDFEGWTPANYDNTSGGKYSMAAALAQSKNLPAMHLYFETGFEKLDYLWNKIGFSTVLKNEPSIALGTASASLFETAIAYAMFANGGYKVEPYCIESITTSEGKVIYVKEKTTSKERLIQEKTANIISAILRKAINEGTGTAIRNQFGVSVPLAGKTGTAQSYSDAWFIGYNPNIVIASRVGANSPSVHFNSGINGSGGKLALPLVGKILAKAQDREVLKALVNKDFLELPEEFTKQFQCDDYKEENKMNQFFNRFKKQETTLDKEQRKSKRRNFNPFKKRE